MPFNSILFVLFFLIFTVLYYYFQNSKAGYFLLFGGSCFFYAYSNIFNLIFLLTTTGLTFVIVNRLKKNRFLVFLGVTVILIHLIFTKYLATVFSEFWATTLPENQYLNFALLPIGISFYSLQAIALLADVQNEKYQGDISLKSISQFLSFFPQAIAGPIHRANELIPQFSTRKAFLSENIIIGFKTVLWGYFCKLIIADKIALIVTPVFNSHLEHNGFSISIAALLYSFQIYFDFWGYSLIAIGVGRILGFTINVNFVNPYSAKSFADFWHKWHITLSKWIRDYIYIPLGGNRQKNYVFFCLSILVVFLVSGFWHGATFNFILWGAIHAFLYLAENLITRLFSINNSRLLRKLIQPFWAILFFILISLTWLIFRTDNISELIVILKSIILFSDWTTSDAINHYLSTTNIIYLLIILTTIFFAHTKIISRLTDTVPVSEKEIVANSVFVCICIVVIILWGDIGGQEFLYFKF